MSAHGAVTPQELGQAVAAGVLDAITALLGGYTVQGGESELPPEFPAWLSEHRAKVRPGGEVVEPVGAPATCDPYATPSGWGGGDDADLAALHESIRLLRGELQAFDASLEAAGRAPTAASTTATMAALDRIRMFLDEADAALGRTFAAETTGSLQ